MAPLNALRRLGLGVLLLTVLFAALAEADTYLSKCCHKGHNCCGSSDVKTGEERDNCALGQRRSICERADTTSRPTQPPGKCGISMPDCQLFDDCLGAHCSVDVPPFGNLGFGFELAPCGPAGPYLELQLEAVGKDLAYNISSDIDVATPLSVSAAGAKEGLYIRVHIGSLANHSVPLEIELVAKTDLIVKETKKLATIYQGAFPVSVC
ncbi:uncharacterized protein MONBRDRAFT_38959 [Monosiga brevicollis MX1]|uniref:Uncharacterized protein n=1 Tax=Monosiga brevicollis TaxID=81824 RepID=A9VB67_MONBE|nr:uncharacterized protein MONBRDRAFT_38959 [Monosiga brevicollis MX1]EDQ85133.1 predicted protein [Monosiga brevicollis MX1]|eukprot:XP_001749958.1 hypothetical protein [Monosiga brevicollis MX1]